MANPTAPAYIIGTKDLTALSITPVVVAADGTMTPGTSVSVKKYFKSMRFALKQVADNVTSSDSFYENNVPIMQSYSLALVEKTRRTISGVGPAIAAIVWGAAYGFVTFTRGVSSGTQTAETFTFYGMWSENDEGMDGPGGQESGLTLIPIDTTYGVSTTLPVTRVVA